jgi:hypothetical protein
MKVEIEVGESTSLWLLTSDGLATQVASLPVPLHELGDMQYRVVLSRHAVVVSYEPED